MRVFLSVGAIALAAVFGSSEVSAQLVGNSVGDPTAKLAQLGQDSLVNLFNLASAVGAVAMVVGGILTYFDFLPRSWLMKILVITAVIVIGPQVIQFIYSAVAS